MYKIYHNPRCRKSRAGLKYLENNGLAFEIVKYLEEGITFEELKNLLILLNKKPLEMIRKQEDIYKKNYKGKEFSDDEWIKIMVENPKLINRPIVVRNQKAVWGDPPENIKELA